MCNGTQVSEPREENTLKKKLGRPCKGKRHRFNKFVDRLKMDVLTKKEAFSVEDVYWPPHLLANDSDRQKVIRILEAYQLQVLSGV